MAALQESMPSLSAAVARDYPTVALVLQGGGALGAYQAGVFEAMDEAGLQPTRLAGISIGALNTAIIAGNAPARRVERLREFWETVCHPLPWASLPAAQWLGDDAWPDSWLEARSSLAAMRALLEGQPGFFEPRWPPAWMVAPVAPTGASWYDTAPLRSTLERLVDFDRINDPRGLRVAVGAVNVHSGNFAFFDNRRQRLRPEHFMASGALPPGFPAVEIDGEFYWDGGMVSNTPLREVLGKNPGCNSLVFQVDLWSARGMLPHDLAGVADRSKEIQYSSRTRLITEFMQRVQEHQRLLHDVMALVPPAQRKDPAYRRAAAYAAEALTNVIHLIYQDKPLEGHFKDYEFSAASMRGHWQSGREDMRHTLAHPKWFALPDPGQPFVTHDVHRVTSARLGNAGA